jgi:hypothetical protein
MTNPCACGVQKPLSAQCTRWVKVHVCTGLCRSSRRRGGTLFQRLSVLDVGSRRYSFRQQTENAVRDLEQHRVERPVFRGFLRSSESDSLARHHVTHFIPTSPRLPSKGSTPREVDGSTQTSNHTPLLPLLLFDCSRGSCSEADATQLFGSLDTATTTS